jgi:lipopolysaccharide export LptBFGC system permease protein LptF
MRISMLIFVLWVLGSIGTYYASGTKHIIAYALVTMALFALAVWLDNRKKA